VGATSDAANDNTRDVASKADMRSDGIHSRVVLNRNRDGHRAITVVGTTIIAITIIWIARADNNADARTQPHQPQPADAFVGVSAMSAIAKAPTRQTLPFSFISSYVESPVLANNTGLLIDHSI
jgi:hypothetical protein